MVADKDIPVGFILTVDGTDDIVDWFQDQLVVNSKSYCCVRGCETWTEFIGDVESATPIPRYLITYNMIHEKPMLFMQASCKANIFCFRESVEHNRESIYAT